MSDSNAIDLNGLDLENVTSLEESNPNDPEIKFQIKQLVEVARECVNFDHLK